MSQRIAPKYRSLRDDELNELESEFVEFLVMNGITADQWVKIKEDECEVAEDMIILFSDVVLEGVLRKVKFLEIRSKTYIKTFHCLEEKIILAGMSSENSDDVDFTNPESVKSYMSKPPKGVKIYTTEKNYNNKREMEIYGMTQAGCAISDGDLFKSLSLAMIDA